MPDDLTPEVVKGQAALFDDPQQLVDMPAEDFNALALAYAKTAAQGFKQMRREVGLICWAQRFKLGEGAYGSWLASYAQVLEVSERTLRDWRDRAQQTGGLALPPAQAAKQREQNPRSADRVAKTATPTYQRFDARPSPVIDAPPAVDSTPAPLSDAEKAALAERERARMAEPGYRERLAESDAEWERVKPAAASSAQNDVGRAVALVVSTLQWLDEPRFQDLSKAVKAEANRRRDRRRELRAAAEPDGQPKHYHRWVNKGYATVCADALCGAVKPR